MFVHGVALAQVRNVNRAVALKTESTSDLYTSLQCVTAVTLANRRGLLAFSYHSGMPAQP